MRNGCNDPARFCGQRFERIVAKNAVSRIIRAARADSEAGKAAQRLCEAVKYFWARVAEPSILDIRTFEEATMFARSIARLHEAYQLDVNESKLAQKNLRRKGGVGSAEARRSATLAAAHPYTPRNEWLLCILPLVAHD